MGGCDQLATCGMCLWDASVVEAGHILDYACQWCLEKGKCVSNATAEAEGCTTVLDTVVHNSHRGQCPDLQCHLAPISFNVYVCEGVVIGAFWMNVAILMCCIGFIFWVKTIGQHPWKFQGLTNVARSRWQGMHTDVDDLELGAMQSSTGSRESVEQRSTTTNRQEKSCYACTANQECDWCSTARIAFLPVLISTVTCIANILATILFSLRRNFFEPYTLTTSSIAVFTMLAFVYHISRLNGPTWDPYYLRLTVLLKGRSVAQVFPIYHQGHIPQEPPEPATPRRGAIEYLNQFPSFFGELYNRVAGVTEPQPQPTGQPDEGAYEKAREKPKSTSSQRVETPRTPLPPECSPIEAEEEETPLIRVSEPVLMLVDNRHDPLVSIVKSLEPRLMNKLKSVLEENEDDEEEAVVWCYRPSIVDLVMHDVLFFHIMGTVMAGSTLFFLIASDPDLPLTKIVGRTNLYVIGCVVLASACTLVSLFIISCSRVYVLTTHHILTLYYGLWNVTATVQHKSDVKCAMVFTYYECGKKQIVFSWRQPAGPDRRMKAPACAQFPCIKKPEDLIKKLLRFCPPVDDRVWRDTKGILLNEWRVYMAFFYGLLLLSITSFHYKTVPTNILILGTVCCGSACVGVFMRGMRYHNASYRPVVSKAKKSKHRKPLWVPREVEQAREITHTTEEVLESIASKRLGPGQLSVPVGVNP
eukprot:TRINITY_DN3202_c0_g2_i1.p1 TRINITY_DN3202_c0_g2~~TRINITY_DN3202_c0_g2_i1.p1  ORF type:complete len:700 (+),score=193.07 TRINITY_DN3202_c0_g2_i1:31-2130(+)